MTDIIREGGQLTSAGDNADRLNVFVQLGAVSDDAIEISLRTPTWMRYRKEVIIRESPAAGRGEWVISTENDRHEDHNGLYVYQLEFDPNTESGAQLLLNKAGFLGVMVNVFYFDLTTAIPGSRITLLWTNDGSYRFLRGLHGNYFPLDGNINVYTVAAQVPEDSVEFELVAVTDPNRFKEIVIHESPFVGDGEWSISTLGDRRNDRNGLYTYQLQGAFLIFRSENIGVADRCMMDITQLKPGARITFEWSQW